MKKARVTTVIMAALIGLTAMSCNDGKSGKSINATTPEEGHHPEAQSSAMEHAQMNGSQVKNPEAQKVLADYMALKDALVATDENAAATAGKNLESTLNAFNLNNFTPEQQSELKDIIEDATEHAEHIGKSKIDHQREHFQILSKDMMDMVAITGTNKTLYQQFCPMYDKEGGVWLSYEKPIQNPYFGSKMMKCGEVQKEIN